MPKINVKNTKKKGIYGKDHEKTYENQKISKTEEE